MIWAIVLILNGLLLTTGAVAIVHGWRQNRSGPEANQIGHAERKWRDD